MSFIQPSLKTYGTGFVLLALFMICPIRLKVMAQNPGQLKFEHLTQQDGLSQSSGHAILQDSRGYMWFGTNDGLNKYNGYNMTVYQHIPDDSTSISGNNISYIYEDSRNNLWVGTTGAGLNLFDRSREKFLHFKIDYANPGVGISDNSITSILETKEGKFWIGTYNGLNYFDRDTGEFVHFYANPANPKSLSSSFINTLYEDSKGNMWIGTNDGLNLWDPMEGTFSRFLHDPADPKSISGNDVMNIYEDQKRNLWIGTTEGLNRLNRQTGEFERFVKSEDPGSISGNSIFSILEDSRGILWVGTENNGLNVFDREGGRFYSYKQNLDNPNSLSNNAIYSLYENDDQILWIGTYSGGINYLDRKKSKFEHYKYDKNAEHPLSANSVTSFLEDSDGNVWIGTDGGGLNRFDRETGEFHTLRHNPENANTLSSDVVLALLEDHNGDIWIGYYDGGLSRYDYDKGVFKHYKYIQDDRNSLCQDNVFALYEDNEHNIWAGTNGAGVCKLNRDTGRFTQYQAGEGVIRDIYEDSRNNFWLATYGGGLKLLDRRKNEVWNFYEGDNGLQSNVVLSIHEDKSGNFWIGTKEGGLHLFDRDSLTFTSFNESDGLPDNEVKGILEDEQGNLWLSTNNGISKFNPDDESFFNFTAEDGLQADEFNTLAYYKDRQGYMYFGGINGFNRFHPDSIKIEQTEYPVVFTDFRIFNKSVPIGGKSPLSKHISQTHELVLPYTASVLTFEYAALNFNKLKGIRYAYMLEGFEDNWNHVDLQRTATYTNLSPGEYTLKVKSSNSDGIWNDEGASLAITITPPFWRTSWFYVLSVLFFAGVIFGVYRYRVRTIRAQNKQLSQKVSERTSELHKKNQDLKAALEELQDTKDELVEKAHKAGMADIATGVLHNVGNILNSVNTSAAVIEDTMKQSKLEGLQRANGILREHIGNMETFVAGTKGKQLIQYYLKLEPPLKSEQDKVIQQSERLIQKINLIKEVITAQQSYAGTQIGASNIILEDMVNDALTLEAGSIDRHGLKIHKQFESADPIVAQRSKIVHVLVNLIKNAKEAMADNPPEQKELTIRIWQDADQVYLSIADSGTGIKKEHLTKIFTHGFTTKKTGHGFGLHSCANYMTEMGGKIQVRSEGEGKGAEFTLVFPKISVNGQHLSTGSHTADKVK